MADVLGVSARGTFKSKRTVGFVAALRRATSVDSGLDAVDGTRVSRDDGRSLVATAPAKLTDLISSSRITFSCAPHFYSGC